MDLLNGYSSSDSNSDTDAPKDDSIIPQKPPHTIPSIKVADRRYLQAAPTPSVLATLSIQQKQNPTSTTMTKSNQSNSLLMNNPLKSTLTLPIHGPTSASDPTSQTSLSKGKVGNLQTNVTFDHTAFEEQRKSFQRSGVALGPDDRGSLVERGEYGHVRRRYCRETQKMVVVEPKLNPVDTLHRNLDDDEEEEEEDGQPKHKKRPRTEPLVEGSDDETTYGIWGPPTTTQLSHADDRLTDLQKHGGIETSLPPEILAEREHIKERDRRKTGGTGEGGEDPESRENRNFDKLVERKMAHLLPPRLDGEDASTLAIEPTTRFHGAEELDYRGRSWTNPPTELRERVEVGDVDHHRCYVPKKCVGRLTGHNKGVHRIRLSPGTGHLLLSGGLDGKCKVWSVHTKRVMRTYLGHSAAVRDVAFNNDGSKFLSASFDRFIRLWNTETGVVEGTFSNRRVPYVVKFYPKDDTTFVAGCSDNKIVAYSTETGEITQEYNHHLAPVNTITFVEDHGMKMVTSSDDKKVLVWEWDIGVPIKYISDPTMHSMPAITLHPTGAFMACQSLDNRICVYQGSGKFSLQRKKKFVGHQVAGYACDLVVSPDGQFLCSGDGHGKLCFWEWRMHKMLQKYRAHEKGPTIGCVWHPVLPSTVFTCGWDGVIKMWE